MPDAPRHAPQHPRRPPSGGVQQPRPPRREAQQPRPPGGSRAERRAAGTKRSRLLQVIAVIAVLALLGAAAFFFLRGGDEGTTTGGKTDKEVTLGDLELVVGAVYNANAGVPAQLPVDIQNGVMTTVGSYVQGAVMDPVREGEVAEDVPSLFDAVTAPRLDGPDRAVIIEEGLPELTGNFEPAAQPVILSALSDASGAFQLVTATLNYSALFETDAGEVRSSRYHELTLRPDGAAWKITSYDIVVIREGPGELSTTTTAAA